MKRNNYFDLVELYDDLDEKDLKKICGFILEDDPSILINVLCELDYNEKRKTLGRLKKIDIINLSTAIDDVLIAYNDFN